MKLIILILTISTLFSNSYAKEVKILSSINPIHQIVNYISDGKGDLLVNPNSSNHEYMLKPSDIRKIKDADLIFYIDDNFEVYLTDILRNNKNSRIIKLTDIADLKLIKNDYHLWLNPDNAIIIARNIADNLAMIDKDNKDKYQKRLKDFTQQVKFMSSNVNRLLDDVRHKNYGFYHNGYKYFEDYYNFKSSLVISKYHHQKLTIKDMSRIANSIKSNNILCLFGQKQEESNLALKIAQQNQVKFSILDITGSQENHSKNGYIELIDNFTKEIIDCLKSN